jgi:hypothetical protein
MLLQQISAKYVLTVQKKKLPAKKTLSALLLNNILHELFYLFILINTVSSAAHQISLCRGMLGSNPVLLRLWHWQPDALHHSARSHPLCTVAMIPSPHNCFWDFWIEKDDRSFSLLCQTSMSLNCPGPRFLLQFWFQLGLIFRPPDGSVCTWPNHYPQVVPQARSLNLTLFTHSFTHSP